jgi:alginate O-acetyltransferase complex protein AlgI
MIGSIFIDYMASKGIENNRENQFLKKSFLALSLIMNIGLLMGFKYANFFIENLNTITGLRIEMLTNALPLGISFYTFQTMSYTLDVYKGKVSAENNIIHLGAYVSMFPQLIAGPIVKYTDVVKELRFRNSNWSRIEDGIYYFIMGLSSKVLIANNVGMLWNDVETIGFENISTPLAWIGLLGFAFQIYFDFSGYSMMAIGLGKIMGFEFPKNFDFPYESRSITEFWRRWHITLGMWFRE